MSFHNFKFLESGWGGLAYVGEAQREFVLKLISELKEEDLHNDLKQFINQIKELGK